MCLNRLGSLEIPGAVPGPPGNNGNNGDPGPQGPAGVGWITGQGIPPNNLTTYPNGTLYLDTLLGNVFQYNASTLQWSLVASIRGPQGYPGEQGSSGPPGGSGIIYRGGTTVQQTISSNSQVISLGGFSASGNQLMGSLNDMVKICCSTRAFTQPLSTNTFSAIPYPHIIRMKINNINITDDLFTIFTPPPNSQIAIKYFYSNVEAKIIRTSVPSFTPLVHVTYTTSTDAGFFQYTTISNIDFSIPCSITFELESIATGANYSPTRVTATNWIERYLAV